MVVTITGICENENPVVEKVVASLVETLSDLLEDVPCFRATFLRVQCGDSSISKELLQVCALKHFRIKLLVIFGAVMTSIKIHFEEQSVVRRVRVEGT